ncbi:MAG: CRISPR-associated exonuclease Cas4 [Clostridiales bacterium]|jgi:CRISPR-associated exonuclease Cas4|nr:CRISPR-associated exonuclease Cas4 [Clostridiales bacterium]
MIVTGTLINYYFHCKRQCWLFANRINLEDNSENVRIGKVLHELKNEGKKNTDITIDNIKVDKITDQYLVEIKKSDADTIAVKWQVLLYLKKLKDKGIKRDGKIEYIEKNKQNKKIHYIKFTDENEKELNLLLDELKSFIKRDMPPIAELLPKCKKCAYFEYCFI